MENLTIDFLDQKPQGLQINFLDQQKPRAAKGVWDAIQAGWQGSVPGLIDRGKLPDIVLDPHHATWYEKLAASASQMVNEIPESVAGAVGVGFISKNPIAAGAASMAVPTAIRESLIQSYSKGEVVSSGDFLSRAGIVIKQAAKDALVGGLTTGIGGKVMSATGSVVKTSAAEVATMTVAPAALEGRLPEPEDFLNGAILLGGMKGATHVAGKLRDIYAKTGVRPEEVLAEAKANPELALDLATPPIPRPADYVPLSPTHKVDHKYSERHVTTANTWHPFDPMSPERPPTGVVFEADGVKYTVEKSITGPKVSAWGEGTRKSDGQAQWYRVGSLDFAKEGDKFVPANVNVSPGAESMNTILPNFQGKGIATNMLRLAAKADESGKLDFTRVSEGLVTEGGAAALNKFNESRFSENEIPAAFKERAAVQSAMDAVPGVKAQDVVAQPFASIPQAQGEPAKPTHVNYNYINTPDDVKGAMARLSEVYQAEIQTQRRGTVSWEQTQVEAGKIIADMLGSTEPFRPREPGTPAGAAELLARKQMVVGAAEDMASLAKQYDPLTATPEQTAAFLASVDRAAMIQGEFLGARAEAGRALNILKETKIAAERSRQIQDLISRFGKDPAELAAMIRELDNPASALKFAREAVKASTWDKVVEAWKAGLVSGPITNMRNILGNVGFMATRPAVDAVAAVWGTLRGNADRVSAVEPIARVVGNLHGTMDGLKQAWVALREEGVEPGKAEHRQAIEGKLGYAVRTPFRFLAAGDALFKEMNRRGELYSMATNQVAKDGLNPATREFRERVAEIVSNPTEAMVKAADDAALRYTFQAPHGEQGRALQNLIRTAHLEWAVPFISTPGNVFKETARLTPFAPIVGEWREAVKKGGVEADRAVAELAVGAGVMALTFSFALDGKLSGAGDPDPAKRRAQMAAGWQPYSIKIGDTWYSYQGLQPVSTVVGLAADMAGMWEHMTPEESDKLPKMLSVAFANSVTNATFLKGLTSIVQAMADPERYGPRFVQDQASSWVPSIIGQSVALYDPYVREVDSVKEAIMNRLPGLRQQLPMARDAFGEPVQNKERLGGVSPITTTTESKDKVRTEAARLKIGFDKTPKDVQLPSAGDRKLGKVELTPEQRDVFADVGGHFAYQALHGIVNSPAWDNMPDMAKERAYKIAFEAGHKAGKMAAISDEQRQKEIMRITSEIAKRLAQ